MIYSIYFDGGCRHKKCLYAFIVYDENKKIIHQKSGRCGDGTSNDAEYRALLISLKWCLENHIYNAKILGDSKLVINQITGKWECSDKFIQLRDQILNLLKKFDNWDAFWIKRYYNKEADRLIKETIKKCWPKKRK